MTRNVHYLTHFINFILPVIIFNLGLNRNYADAEKYGIQKTTYCIDTINYNIGHNIDCEEVSISIVQALHGRMQINNEEFCGSPYHQKNISCTSKDNRIWLTNEVRRVCNGFSHCALPTSRNPKYFDECTESKIYQSITYLTVEYFCLHQPEIFNFKKMSTMAGHAFSLHNENYNGWAELSKTYVCSLQAPRYTIMQIHVLDMWAKSSDNGSTPFCLAIRIFQRKEFSICWNPEEPEVNFQPISVTLAETAEPVVLEVKPLTQQTMYRLWIHITISATSLKTKVECFTRSVAALPPPITRGSTFPSSTPRITQPAITLFTQTTPTSIVNHHGPGVIIGAIVGAVLAVLAIIIVFVVMFICRKRRKPEEPRFNEDSLGYATHMNSAVGQLQGQSTTFTPEYKEHVYQNQQPSKDRENLFDISAYVSSELGNKFPPNKTNRLTDDGYSFIKEFQQDGRYQNIDQCSNDNNNGVLPEHQNDGVTDTYAKPNKDKKKNSGPVTNNLQADVSNLYAKPLKESDRGIQPPE